MKNRIEIFILTYNRAEMLKDSIISLLNQSIGKIKITVLDNASTDNTENLVKELMAKNDNLYYFKQECNKGGGGNFAKAIELANADYIMTFHDDDILHPDYLKYALKVINKYPNISIVSSNYKEYTNPTNENWNKASSYYKYCSSKRDFVNYLYRMQKYGYPPTIYKTSNLKKCIYNSENGELCMPNLEYDFLKQFGKMSDKPFVIETMQENDGAVIFQSRALLRYRVHAGQDTTSGGPSYSEIIAYNKYCKKYMQNNLYEKFMYNLINYKQLKQAYVWNNTNELSLNEFIQKAIDEGAGCKWTELCLHPIYGKFFIRLAYWLRKIFKSKYKRGFFF